MRPDLKISSSRPYVRQRTTFDNAHSDNALQQRLCSAAPSQISSAHTVESRTQMKSTANVIATSNWFEPFDEEDRHKENAFKAVLIISLCITVCAWTSFLTLCPILYQFLSFSSSQFDGMLQFCEDTAKTVASDSFVLVDNLIQRQEYNNYKNFIYHNQTNSRGLRQAPTQTQFHENIGSCRCESTAGPRGNSGRKGMKGTPGAKGAPGIPARLPCEPLQDLKKYCPEKCPQGLQGSPGQRGPSGDKGKNGPIGLPGKNGADGKTGQRGMPGPPGVPGLDGEDGDAGADAQPTPFIPGPPGLMGAIGDSGPPGPRGLPGIDGPQGPQGRKGSQGDAGRMGTPGLPGPAGPIGEPGEDGHKGVCPTYCAMDGGVFFVEPPEWFFKNQRQ